MKKAFSLLEIVFVIIIIGVLSSILIPKLSFGRYDASFAKAKSQIATIKSSIALYYNKNILISDPIYPDSLDDIENGSNDKRLFKNILKSPIVKKANSSLFGWIKLDKKSLNDKTVEKYRLFLKDKAIDFIYTQENGAFECDYSLKLCVELNR